VWGGASALRHTAVGGVLAGSLTGVSGIALLVALLAGVVALAGVNGSRILLRRAQKPRGPPAP